MVLYPIYYTVNAVACLLALLRWRHHAPPLRYQWAYLLLNLLSELYVACQATYSSDVTFIYNYVIIAEYGFYTWLIGSQFRSPAAKRVAYGSIAVFGLLGLLNLLVFSNLLEYNYCFLTRCLLFVISTCWYYYELYTEQALVHITRLPTFWISSGFFIFCMGSFFVMGLYALLRGEDRALANMLYTLILPSLNIILYTSYIMATLCNPAKRS